MSGQPHRVERTLLIMPDCTENGTSSRLVITLQDFHIPLEEAFTVTLSNTLEYAVEVMDLHNVDQLPVVDTDYHGAMVVTRRMIATVQPSARESTLVQDVLGAHSNDPDQRAHATTSLAEAKRLLIKYDWILTTDDDNNPVGLATVGDALNELLKHHLT